MIDFTLTDEQQAIRDLARAFAQEHLRAKARDIEQNPQSVAEIELAIHATGLLLPYKEEFGGSGEIDTITLIGILEELGNGDAAIAVHLLGKLLGVLAVARSGTYEQQQSWLSSYSRDPLGHSIAYCPFEPANNELSSLSGRAANIPGAVDARWLALQTQGNDDRIYLFQSDAPGIQITRTRHNLGLTSTTLANLEISDTCAEERIAVEMSAQPEQAATLPALSKLLYAAILLGLSRASMEYAFQYASTRIQFGQPILINEAISFTLAEIAMDIDTIRLLIWSACEQIDKNQTVQPEPILRKAKEVSRKATSSAVQILGGAGYMVDHPVEMWMRQAAEISVIC